MKNECQRYQNGIQMSEIDLSWAASGNTVKQLCGMVMMMVLKDSGRQNRIFCKKCHNQPCPFKRWLSGGCYLKIEVKRWRAAMNTISSYLVKLNVQHKTATAIQKNKREKSQLLLFYETMGMLVIELSLWVWFGYGFLRRFFNYYKVVSK